MGKFFKVNGVGLPLAVVVGMAAVPAAHADVTVSLNPSSDAIIFGTAAGADTGNASGMGPAFFAGADGQGNIKRSLLEFNASSIPANAIITGATMTLYLAQVAGTSGGTGNVGNSMDRQFGLYDVLQPWAQGTSGSPTSTNVGGSSQGYARVNGDVTWDFADYNSNSSFAVLWNASGTALHGGNFTTPECALLDVPVGASLSNNEPFSWTSPGMVANVQGWVSGILQNNGWMLKSDNLEGTKTSFLGFWSKDGAAATSAPGLAPTLSITYSLPAPEPASLALLGAGLPKLLTRRRAHRTKRAA